jgi:succinate-semialdehyde dehydrogenase
MGLKWRNTGQACISANRVYVHAGVYEKFAKITTERTSELIIGHGAFTMTRLCPVTTPQSLDRALEQIRDARSHGAGVLLGGERVRSSKGFFLQATTIGEATSHIKLLMRRVLLQFWHSSDLILRPKLLVLPTTLL